jgi:crotonobetainyl-CoA:carnitine CoA-transferase CaiB-like acyl-CoA transferase
VGNDQQFARLATVLGHAEWALDPRFRTNVARLEHRAELISLLGNVLQQLPASEWIAMCRQSGIPASAVRTVDEVLGDAQVRQLGLIATYDHPVARVQECIACPIALEGMETESSTPPPMFSEHADEILAGLGYDRSQIERLNGAAVVIPFSPKIPERSGRT